MAKLYRRIPRLPHRDVAKPEEEQGEPAPRVTAPEPNAPADEIASVRCTSTLARAHVLLVLLFAVLLSAPTSARAEDDLELAADDDPRLLRIERLAGELRSDDADVRARAYEALTTLDAEMLPAIRARIARLRRRRPDPARAFEVFNKVRRAAGSQRADDDVDIAPGALGVLGETRNDIALKIVEPLLLWRSLERIGSFEACRSMFPLIALDGDLWKWETRRVVQRMGNRMMAAAIAGRNDSDRQVRDWSVATMRRMGADDPGRAVHGLAHGELADVLRAYAMLRMQSAMAVIVSYVDSEQRDVRRAARWALSQYGSNAVWVLRTEYRNQIGEHPPRTWGYRRVAEALYSHVDEQRLAPIENALAAGARARESGDLETMRRHFDDVLTRAPEIEQAAMTAEGYAALGEARIAARRLAEAGPLYRRALRLAPEHEQASHWRAQIAFVEAELRFANGIFDVHAYRDVLTHDSDHEGAQAALAAVGEDPGGSILQRSARRFWALAAAVLFLLLGIGLLWQRRRASEVELVETSDDSQSFAGADATLADNTLPG